MWKVFFVLLMAVPGVTAADPGPDPGWLVWLEPKFMRAPVSAPVALSERTELVAGYAGENEDVAFSRAEFEGLKLTWEAFASQARAESAARLAELTPEYVRDPKRVIQYAVLTSKKPIVASAVLAPGFLSLFKDTLGEKVLVVVPSRYQAFVFPRLASHYEQYTPMVVSAYKLTSYPVSLEAFEVSADGWRAVGIYEEPE